MSIKLLNYLAANKIDPELFDILYLFVDDYIDLECQVELIQDAYEGALEYISHLKDDNCNLEAQVLEQENIINNLENANFDLEVDLEIKDIIINHHKEFLNNLEDFN
jgi:hypothetical protein